VEWADKHFYLSAESSYVEGRWTTHAVQRAILNAMGNDDIREVDFRKSARIGYTKMLVAATLYLAEHKKRNIGIWREDDDAAAEFVNLELNPAMRDCKPIVDIFPDIHRKSEKNKVDEKHLLGCSIHIRGGEAAGGYRALSKDVVIGDEIDGFLQNVRGKSSKEGNPMLLMLKRLVGSSFPKAIFGTTPTTSGASHIERREKAAECRMYCEVPCPHCGEYQVLKFGNGKESYGFRWDKDDPDSVRYLCECCAAEFEYSDYLDVTERCVWRDREADIETRDGLNFYSIKTGHEKKTPRSICFIVWAAYSPTSPWSTIVIEWLEAKNDKESLQVFRNTTQGEYWYDGVKEKLDSDALFRRREYYPRNQQGEMVLPQGALYLTAGVDTQDNRFAFEIIAWGQNRENWSVEYREIMGKPDDPETWKTLVALMRRTFPREDGAQLSVGTVFHDAGGSFYDDVLENAAHIDPEWWIPVKGDFAVGASYIKLSNSAKPKEFGCYLFMMGTTTVGDMVHRQLTVNDPEPICHWPITTEEDAWYTGHDLRYFQMLTAEERKLKMIKGRDQWIWECPSGVRNEAWDCRRYATAALVYAETYGGIDLRNGIMPKAIEEEPRQVQSEEDDYWGDR